MSEKKLLPRLLCYQHPFHGYVVLERSSIDDKEVDYISLEEHTHLMAAKEEENKRLREAIGDVIAEYEGGGE